MKQEQTQDDQMKEDNMDHRDLPLKGRAKDQEIKKEEKGAEARKIRKLLMIPYCSSRNIWWESSEVSYWMVLIFIQVTIYTCMESESLKSS